MSAQNCFRLQPRMRAQPSAGEARHSPQGQPATDGCRIQAAARDQCSYSRGPGTATDVFADARWQ